ncbi:E3 ubiquitin-protein ligase BRE1-like 1 [Tasmannia lanceolata]|uniref:E3 ubiquitin-protein ligase BRE1-like 1 n=1 Tax=Tasmannia lanceolata TaxID=3420 RepID=UPI004062BD80
MLRWRRGDVLAGNYEFHHDMDVIDARDLEYKAWAHVQSLKSSLDEHNLEWQQSHFRYPDIFVARSYTIVWFMCGYSLLKMWSEQVGKLTDDGRQSSVALESTRSRLLDVQKVSQELRQSLDVSQSKVQRSSLNVAELQIELEKERFEKKSIEEQLEVARRKVACLTAHTEGSSVLEKHQQEL